MSSIVLYVKLQLKSYHFIRFIWLHILHLHIIVLLANLHKLSCPPHLMPITSRPPRHCVCFCCYCCCVVFLLGFERGGGVHLYIYFLHGFILSVLPTEMFHVDFSSLVSLFCSDVTSFGCKGMIQTRRCYIMGPWSYYLLLDVTGELNSNPHSHPKKNRHEDFVFL